MFELNFDLLLQKCIILASTSFYKPSNQVLQKYLSTINILNTIVEQIFQNKPPSNTRIERKQVRKHKQIKDYAKNDRFQ